MTILKIRYVVRVESVPLPTLDGAPRWEKKYMAPAHMVEAVKMGHTTTVGPLTLCGLTQSELGFYNSDVLNDAPKGIAVCRNCEREWKRHPASPWRAFVGLSVLVLFLLACMSPSVAAAVLTPADPASTETARMATPTEGRPVREGARCMVVKAESLHVRDLPGYEVGQVVGYLFGGQVVRVFDWQEVDGTRWYQVREGWSSGAWMEAAECLQFEVIE